MKIIPFYILFALLAGCASLQEESAPSQSSAVSQLMSEAEAHSNNGNLEKSAATLERALRLEPNNAWLWYELAIVHKLQANYSKALELARRARGYANQTSLVRKIDSLLRQLAAP